MEWNIIGESPRSFCIFTSCDSNYLKDHAQAYVTSCAKAQNNVHLHVVNATTADWTRMQILKIGYEILYPAGKMTISSEDVGFDSVSKEAKRTYYSCNRFIVASSILTAPMMITDIDCLIMKHIEPLDTDIGLFLREPLPDVNEWEKQGSKIAAGAVYVTPKSKVFLQAAAKIILNNELRWFLDQAALNASYENYKTEFTITAFGPNFMDWEFIPDTTIWTGKGDRKYNNQKYLNMKKHYNDLFPNVRTEYWK